MARVTSASAEVRSTVACPEASAWIRQRPSFQGARGVDDLDDDVAGRAPRPAGERLGQVDEPHPEAVVGLRRRRSTAGRPPRASTGSSAPPVRTLTAADQVEVDEPAQQVPAGRRARRRRCQRPRARRRAGLLPLARTRRNTANPTSAPSRCAKSTRHGSLSRSHSGVRLADPFVVRRRADDRADVDHRTVTVVHPLGTSEVGDGRQPRRDGARPRSSRPGAVRVAPRDRVIDELLRGQSVAVAAVDRGLARMQGGDVGAGGCRSTCSRWCRSMRRQHPAAPVVGVDADPGQPGAGDRVPF